MFKLYFSESALKTDLEKGVQFISEVNTGPPWMAKPKGVK
jgi:hypothetical protein